MAGRLALSPEFTARLTDQFPRGTDESAIVSVLHEQGFEQMAPCEADSSVRSASFHQHGGNLFLMQMKAEAFWQVDESGKILWTKGFVFYLGL